MAAHPAVRGGGPRLVDDPRSPAEAATGTLDRMAGAATTFAAAAVLAAALLTGCDTNPPDRQQQTDQVTAQIRSLPAVESATDVVVDSFAEGRVYAEVHVRAADGATPDQVAAIATAFLDHLHAVDYSGYRTELDVTRGANEFVVGDGRRPLTNDQQIVQQARDWVNLSSRFPAAALTLYAAIRDQPAAGRLELGGSTTYADVAAAYPALAATAPGLSTGHWIVGAGKEHPAEITSTGRWPSDAELRAWTALNADKAVPHAVSMTVNGPTTGPLWVAEVTRSREVTEALQLAQRHLPIVATLPPPVLYTATDSWSGHLDATGQATSPVAVSIGGCTRRTYPAAPEERALIDRYETCRH